LSETAAALLVLHQPHQWQRRLFGSPGLVLAVDVIPTWCWILNDVLRTTVNAECRGKATTLQPISDSMVSFLNFF
jgi:hypothetical protein